MTAERARAGGDWLALREPADAAARASELVGEVLAHLPETGMTVHDLGCGTGSMARWLAPQLAGPQHWVMHDLDPELLPLAAEQPPGVALDGATVTTETRQGDVTQLDPGELADASLITASALLDVLTTDELRRLVSTCAGPGCPVLVTLSVTGDVELTPHDPLDRPVNEAFNTHQRRGTPAGRLLGPDAVEAAVDEFTRLGHEVRMRPSPWRLGSEHARLAAAWFAGWVSAACEQRPDLHPAALRYEQRRLADAAAGRLSVVVEHMDLLAGPR